MSTLWRCSLIYAAVPYRFRLAGLHDIAYGREKGEVVSAHKWLSFYPFSRWRRHRFGSQLRF